MKINSLLVLLAFAGLGGLQAETIATTTTTSGKNMDTAVQAKEKSIYDRIWSLAQIYKDNNNHILEELDFTGRFQMDYFNVNSDQGDNNFFEIRRFRLGADSWWADRHLQLKATVDTNLRSFGADSVFYNRLTDIYAKFVFSEAFNFRVGKFEPHFGYDRSMSDNLLKTFERTSFDDHVIGGSDYMSGAEISGKVGNWGYVASIHSTQVDREFGSFDGGQAYLASISYDFSKGMGVDKALLVLDYVHADGKNKETNAFTNYSNGVVSYFDYQKGKFGLTTQVGYGEGVADKGDIYHFMLMPTYKITDKLEVIGRYQLGLSSEDNGLGNKNRQEKTVGSFTGDTYNAAYVGLNYYLYGQKLKLMVGEQYADLGGGTGAKAGYSGWTSLVGLRVYW